ncbi:hypothetical protein DY000_02031980 [Brassica cretica]|uniref:Uncharacterized protein n=1 Tax=Brassica cretica TaxID=69181 RepID=A0ABQ7DU73_BRACR|nr:hypothetical protein DY000_02031980 [Brassica cretica]
MPPRSRLSQEEKGKDIADSPSPTRDASAIGSPLDDFDLIHHDALRDTENMTLSQRLFIAEAHRLNRDEGADRVEVGSSDVSGSENRGGDQSDTAAGFERGDADASGRSPTPSRQVRKRVRFDQIDCRPTIYHPGGIFEELLPLPRGLLRDPRAQSWGNVFGSCASHHTVKDLLRANGGAGFTYIIPSPEQRPWSPPVGYQCVYESYFGEHTKLWFPIPWLVTSYAGDDYRVLWNQQLVRHPNTIAYPEKFFESAQAIAAHSHLRWPDLSATKRIAAGLISEIQVTEEDGNKEWVFQRERSMELLEMSVCGIHEACQNVGMSTGVPG